MSKRLACSGSTASWFGQRSDVVFQLDVVLDQTQAGGEQPSLARRDRSRGLAVGVDATMSIEFEDESQSIVERYEFLVGHAPDELAESFWRNGRRLLDQDLTLFVVHCDRRTENAWRCRPGSGRHEHGRQHQIIRLHDDGVPTALLFTTSRVTQSSESMDVTTHEARPSPTAPCGFQRGRDCGPAEERRAVPDVDTAFSDPSLTHRPLDRNPE